LDVDSRPRKSKSEAALDHELWASVFVFNRFTIHISSVVRSTESDRVNILGIRLSHDQKHMSESIQSNTLQHQLLRQIESPAASARPSGRPNRVNQTESRLRLSLKATGIRSNSKSNQIKSDQIESDHLQRQGRRQVGRIRSNRVNQSESRLMPKSQSH